MALGERPGKGTEVREQGGLAGDGVGRGRNLKAGPGGLGSGSCPELNKQVLFWEKKKKKVVVWGAFHIV